MTAGEHEGSVNRIGRRTFLRQVEAVAVSAACGSRAALPLFVAACGGARYVSATKSGTQLIVPLADVSSSTGAIVEVEDGELPLYVRKISENNFSAVSTRCMHRGCQVEPEADRLVCPCHGSEYTFNGAVLKGPTERPLVRYRVTADDSKLYIHLDSPLAAGTPK